MAMSTEEEDFRRLKERHERMVLLNWWLLMALVLHYAAFVSYSVYHFLDSLPGK